MLKSIFQSLWGKFESREEIRKFGLLAAIFGLIIGVYWTLRPIKDSAFKVLVGGHYLWIAKLVSLAVVFPLVILYSKLIDKYPRQKVFYILIGVYTALAVAFMGAFMHPTIGFANTVASPYRVIGWIWYAFVESFGSLIVALFWVLVTDITKPDAAKRGFPLVALFGQLGNIAGPFLLNPGMLGFNNSAPIVGIAAAMMLATGLLMYFFMNTTPKSLLAGYESKEAVKKETPKKGHKEPGFFEGLRLIATNSYLLGIFFIVSVYEVIVTIIDYHFKQTAFAMYPGEGEAATFLAGYATRVGIVATLCVLFGVNSIQRKLGMRVSLILLPILVGVAVVAVWFNPNSLSIALWIMVLAKAINYALNQPTLKQLYIPTSKDARYKSQGWIEMFGSRGSKAIASFANGFRGTLGLVAFLSITSITSFGLIGVWFFVAVFVAAKYNTAIDKNEVVC